MVQFRPQAREIIAKVVYYGPPLGGKTTNLRTLYRGYPEDTRGELVVVPAGGDRTIFFDFLPVDAGTLRGMKLRVQLYTVPGQVRYNATRQIVLRGVDAVVFVADSQREMLRANRESWENLKENLLLQGLTLSDMPHSLQYNKRDIKDVVSVEELDTLLNQYNAPFYEAVASEGIGVEETLQGVVRQLARSLRDRFKMTTDSSGSPATISFGAGATTTLPTLPGMPMSFPATEPTSAVASAGPAKAAPVVEEVTKVAPPAPPPLGDEETTHKVVITAYKPLTPEPSFVAAPAVAKPSPPALAPAVWVAPPQPQPAPRPSPPPPAAAAYEPPTAVFSVPGAPLPRASAPELEPDIAAFSLPAPPPAFGDPFDSGDSANPESGDDVFAAPPPPEPSPAALQSLLIPENFAALSAVVETVQMDLDKTQPEFDALLPHLSAAGAPSSSSNADFETTQPEIESLEHELSRNEQAFATVEELPAPEAPAFSSFEELPQVEPAPFSSFAPLTPPEGDSFSSYAPMPESTPEPIPSFAPPSQPEASSFIAETPIFQTPEPAFGQLHEEAEEFAPSYVMESVPVEPPTPPLEAETVEEETAATAEPRAEAIEPQFKELPAAIQRAVPRALAQMGEVRELEVEVPVPAMWTGGRRVTLQLRLTLVPQEEEDVG